MLTVPLKPIGSYLVEAGLLSLGQVEVILADQRATGMKFGEIAVTRGWVKHQTIEYLMSRVILPERHRQTYPGGQMGQASPQPSPSPGHFRQPMPEAPRQNQQPREGLSQTRPATISLPGRQQANVPAVPPRGQGTPASTPTPNYLNRFKPAPSSRPSPQNDGNGNQDDVDWVG
jgi:hypothetical protein